MSYRPASARQLLHVNWVNWLAMQRKVFWLTFITLSLIADLALPLMWGLVASIPLLMASWWLAYRSGWFE